MESKDRYEEIDLGTFEVKSGMIRISDPCYEEGTWCSTSVPAVKGLWKGVVKKSDCAGWGNRCCELIAYAESAGLPVKPSWVKIDAELGVDSGQLGFFDLDQYREKYSLSETDKGIMDTDFAEDSNFYAVCCGVTLGEVGAAVINGGVVSRSGFGDGGYEGFNITNKDGDTIALRVVFIHPEEIDDEEGDVFIPKEKK